MKPVHSIESLCIQMKACAFTCGSVDSNENMYIQMKAYEVRAHATRSTLYKKRRASSCYTLYLIEETKGLLMLHALLYRRNEGQAHATRSTL